MKTLLRLGSGVFRLPLVGAPLHRVWFWCRRRLLALATGMIVARYLRTHSPAKLQIGSGPGGSAHPGWLDTDLMPERWPTARLDATRRFPFPDRTFACVFSEHMIEHIPLAAGRFMLEESFRVLAPGGLIRIATPDLARVLALLNGEGDAAKKYLQWSAGHYRLDPKLPVAPLVINDLFHLHGHQFLYDEATLRAVLAEAGFESIERRIPGDSAFAELRGLEAHHHVIGDAPNLYETLVLEARKP